jgi:hypothetical protein
MRPAGLVPVVLYNSLLQAAITSSTRIAELCRCVLFVPRPPESEVDPGAVELPPMPLVPEVEPGVVELPLIPPLALLPAAPPPALQRHLRHHRHPHYLELKRQSNL